jgi:hypothetical protein
MFPGQRGERTRDAFELPDHLVLGAALFIEPVAFFDPFDVLTKFGGRKVEGVDSLR